MTEIPSDQRIWSLSNGDKNIDVIVYEFSMFVRRFIPISSLNQLLARIDTSLDFTEIATTLYIQLKEQQFNIDSFRENQSRPSLKSILASLSVDDTATLLDREHSTIFTSYEIDLMESYVMLCGVLMLKQILTHEWERKYSSVGHFISHYGDRLLRLENCEELCQFANVIVILSQYINPIGNKSRFIIMASCLLEGFYHTEDSSSMRTATLSLIFLTETNQACNDKSHRQHISRNNEDELIDVLMEL